VKENFKVALLDLRLIEGNIVPENVVTSDIKEGLLSYVLFVKKNLLRGCRKLKEETGKAVPRPVLMFFRKAVKEKRERFNQ
jgi:hypothetical protein